MTTWHQIRDRAITAFGGEAPNAQTEEICLTAFEESPAWFIGTLEQVELDYAAGKIRSGWGILKRRITDNAQQRNPNVDPSPDRATQIRLAERWIHNAGLLLPTEDELTDALFGPHGPLRDHAGDQLLTRRMTELWQANRGRAQRVEAEMIARAQKHQPAEQDIFA